jgi:hypothetical protein
MPKTLVQSNMPDVKGMSPSQILALANRKSWAGKPPHDKKELARYEYLKTAYFESLRNSDIKAVKVMTGDIAENVTIAELEAEKKLTDEEMLDETQARFKVMSSYVRAMVQGKRMNLIISGAGGTGKSETVRRQVDAELEKHPAKKITFEKGKITPPMIYQLAWEHKEKGEILILDDADGIFQYDDSLMILKAIMDTSAERWVSWRTASKLPDHIEPKFKMEGCLIFLTNLNFAAMMESGSRQAVHLQALMTRAHYIDLKLHTPRQLVTWVSYMTRKHGIGISHGLTKEQQDEVLKWIKEHMNRLRDISLRTVVKLVETIDTAGGWTEDWRTMAEIEMFR